MRKIAFLTALIIFVCSISGCSGNKGPKTSGVKALNVSELKADDQYECGSGDILRSYYEKTADEFSGACKYYEEQGYSLYGYHEMAENRAATYIKGSEMAHIYWIAFESELNIVTSSSNGENLPNAVPEVKGKGKESTVTQLKSDQINGMGYVIKLADGSFVVIDGGWEAVADDLWDALKELNGGEKDILIRCWIMTHSHNDHYSCFITFADKYADKVTLETFMISPLPQYLQEGKDTYLNIQFKDDLAKFKGAKTCYVYTGMNFKLCNLNLEILYTCEELYNNYLSENYNDASIVSRFYNDDAKALFLADAGYKSAAILSTCYGDYLKSDICQVSNHGVEDCPLSLYRFIKAPILFFPCNTELYKSSRGKDVRDGLKNSKYTKEVYIHGLDRYTVPFNAQ